MMISIESLSFFVIISHWVWSSYSEGECDVHIMPTFLHEKDLGKGEKKNGREINARCAKAYDCIDFLPSAQQQQQHTYTSRYTHAQHSTTIIIIYCVENLEFYLEIITTTTTSTSKLHRPPIIF